MATSYYDVAAGLGAAGFAGGLSVAIMNPLDTLKVRYQVSTEPGGMRGFAGQIVRQEGLWRGLWLPGVNANFWGIGVSSVGRVGCYPYVRDGLLQAVGATEKNAGVMFVAGLLAGAVGYLVSSPVYQVKTLAQAEAGLLENGVFATGASLGKAPRYASLVQGLGTLKRDGHLWRGAGALVVRGALLSAGMQVRRPRLLRSLPRHRRDVPPSSAHCAGRLRRLQDLGEAAGRARGRSCVARPRRLCGWCWRRRMRDAGGRGDDAVPGVNNIPERVRRRRGHFEEGRTTGLLPRLHAVRRAARPRVSHIAAADGADPTAGGSRVPQLT